MVVIKRKDLKCPRICVTHMRIFSCQLQVSEQNSGRYARKSIAHVYKWPIRGHVWGSFEC